MFCDNGITLFPKGQRTHSYIPEVSQNKVLHSKAALGKMMLDYHGPFLSAMCQFKQSCIKNCFGKCIDLYPEMETKCGIQNVPQTENYKFVSAQF